MKNCGCGYQPSLIKLVFSWFYLIKLVFKPGQAGVYLVLAGQDGLLVWPSWSSSLAQLLFIWF